MTEERFSKQNTLPVLTSRESGREPLPEKIGPYKVETLLSKGGMSLLYLGLDPKTRETRAIKVLSPSYVNHVEMVDHFLWEAKIIALTSHPNIVKLFDHGKWEGGLYIAMEFIRGVSLNQFIMQQSFSLRRTLNIVLQIAYALCHLHTHGVIHRDLKPENILITEDGEIKVIDFGIAQLHEENIRTRVPGQVMGTPSYMSPEQRDNPTQVSFTSDIYALGVIAYELIVGKISYGMITLSILTQGIRKIISKALAVSVQERYQDIVDFITDLTDYAASSELERERTGSDRAIETMELIQYADQALSSSVPNWQGLDIGLARHRLPEQFGLYSDFFKFANNTFAIVLAQTASSGPSSSIALGILKGMIHALVYPKLQVSTEAFFPAEFARTLSTLVAQEEIKEQFLLAIVKVIPIQDTLTFLSCGFGPLFHLPQRKENLRNLISTNGLLGSQGGTFMEVSDNWREGDLLVLHSFSANQIAVDTPLEAQMKKAIMDSILLSPTRAAETILQTVVESKEYTLTRHPKSVFVIQRIG